MNDLCFLSGLIFAGIVFVLASDFCIFFCECTLNSLSYLYLGDN